MGECYSKAVPDAVAAGDLKEEEVQSLNREFETLIAIRKARLDVMRAIHLLESLKENETTKQGLEAKRLLEADGRIADGADALPAVSYHHARAAPPLWTTIQQLPHLRPAESRSLGTQPSPCSLKIADRQGGDSHERKTEPDCKMPRLRPSLLSVKPSQ